MFVLSEELGESEESGESLEEELPYNLGIDEVSDDFNYQLSGHGDLDRYQVTVTSSEGFDLDVTVTGDIETGSRIRAVLSNSESCVYHGSSKLDPGTLVEGEYLTEEDLERSY